ncbi:hypothetical protein TNIN_187841 [Trichonephila inaurata madagascariensis]|uniref:Uncharacterized protein n=1 Tax=Trichonephila inaurata madagascariensis TaxID=2747483 RepID=A0A8X7C4F4_9ARAC|nr:hypothetical protein TNIN_187841 [Trichonephila inaurata madagascariensis]
MKIPSVTSRRGFREIRLFVAELQLSSSVIQNVKYYLTVESERPWESISIKSHTYLRLMDWRRGCCITHEYNSFANCSPLQHSFWRNLHERLLLIFSNDARLRKNFFRVQVCFDLHNSDTTFGRKCVRQSVNEE